MRALYSTDTLPETLYTAEQCKQLDKLAQTDGVNGYALMEEAAQAALDILSKTWSKHLQKGHSIQCICGAGNNGGDGYMLAALAHLKGFSVSALSVTPPTMLKNEAALSYAFCKKQNIPIQPYSQTSEISGDIIVDAILGTGISGSVREKHFDLIMAINKLKKPVLSLDIASGLCANTGSILGTAISATLTVTFVGLKRGLFTNMGPQQSGQVFFNDLAIPGHIYQKQPTSTFLLRHYQFKSLLKPRHKNSHKGTYGSVLILGGDHMGGAAIMAAESAICNGAGKVYAAICPGHISALLARRPEIIVIPIKKAKQIKSLKIPMSAIIIGPGLGLNRWGYQIIKNATNNDVPLILDGDALTIIAKHPNLIKNFKSPKILTPHPAEAARLLNTTTQHIQSDRFTAAISIANLFNAIVILKGCGTIISDGQSTWLCPAGNPGMAVAGMGDVLTGVIGALIAQKITPINAACFSVWLHSSAGDAITFEQGEIGVMATDITSKIRYYINDFVRFETNLLE